MKTRVLVTTLISVVFIGCDSGIDVEGVVISDSEAIEAAQRFYEGFHGLRAKSSGDSIGLLYWLKWSANTRPIGHRLLHGLMAGEGCM